MNFFLLYFVFFFIDDNIKFNVSFQVVVSSPDTTIKSIVLTTLILTKFQHPPLRIPGVKP